MAPDVDTLEKQIDKLDADVEVEFTELWNAIDKCRDQILKVMERPPAWCTAVIAIISSIATTSTVLLVQHLLK